MSASQPQPHIVIIGAGFAGIYTYKHLLEELGDKARITIINKTNYFLFTPMLHEVATGGLAHHQVVEALREIVQDDTTRLIVGVADKVDLENKKVIVGDKEIAYDYLVIATGATTNFFGTPGAQEHTFILKDLRDAIKLRNYVIDIFEKASMMSDREERRKMLSFVVVGGGATGVEMVTEMADFFFITFKRLYKGVIQKEDISLTLVTQGAELLTPLHESLQRNALRIIRNKGIKVMLNTKVKEITKDGVLTESGEMLGSPHVVWTAGVKAQYPELVGNFAKDQSGRIPVSTYLQMENYNNAFVLGDSALLLQDGKPIPMLAQVAVEQAPYVAHNIAQSIRGKALEAFRYESKGELVSLGRGNAVARIFGITFSGVVAWFIWRTIYLFKFLSGSKRIKIAVDWTVDLFYPRDITKA